jgi:hypothetical protein
MIDSDMTHDDLDDAVYPDDLIVRIADAGTVRVRTIIGNDIGPAGICSLPLHDGTMLHVDYAEPERLVSIDPAGEATSLDTLIGPGRARFARTATPIGDDQAVRLPGRRTSARRPGPSSLPRGGDRALRIGRVAALDAVHHDEDELPIVRGVAGLEFASRATEDETRWILARDEVHEVVTRSLSLMLADRGGLERLLADRSEVGDLVARVAADGVMAADLMKDPRSRLLSRALAEGAPGRVRAAAPRKAAAPRRAPRDDNDHFGQVAAMRIAAATEPMREFAALTSHLGESPRISMPSRGRLRIDWSARPEGPWARVLRADTQVLLALAPVVAERDAWWAETVVPPDLGVVDIVVDTPADTEGTGTSTSSTDRVMAAVDLGRQAVAATVSRRGDASALWQRCADAWAALGDDRRARRALAYADGRAEVTRQATVTDLVREVVDRP